MDINYHYYKEKDEERLEVTTNRVLILDMDMKNLMKLHNIDRQFSINILGFDLGSEYMVYLQCYHNPFSTSEEKKSAKFKIDILEKSGMKPLVIESLMDKIDLLSKDDVLVNRVKWTIFIVVILIVIFWGSI